MKTKEEILSECYNEVKAELSKQFIHGGKKENVMPVALSLAFDRYASQHTAKALAEKDKEIELLKEALSQIKDVCSNFDIALSRSCINVVNKVLPTPIIKNK
jgi:hypothetical protein